MDSVATPSPGRPFAFLISLQLQVNKPVFYLIHLELRLQATPTYLSCTVESAFVNNVYIYKHRSMI